MEDRELLIKPYTQAELAKLYNKSTRTIYRWLKKIEHRVGRPHGFTYDVNQVEMILAIWDLPELNNEIKHA